MAGVVSHSHLSLVIGLAGGLMCFSDVIASRFFGVPRVFVTLRIVAVSSSWLKERYNIRSAVSTWSLRQVVTLSRVPFTSAVIVHMCLLRFGWCDVM